MTRSNRAQQQKPVVRDPEPPNKIPDESVVSPVIAILEIESEETIPSHRQCPLCWGRCKGVGISYSKQGRTRYYKCKRTLSEFPPCGHTWTADVKIEVLRVEHRIVELNGER